MPDFRTYHKIIKKMKWNEAIGHISRWEYKYLCHWFIFDIEKCINYNYYFVMLTYRWSMFLLVEDNKRNAIIQHIKILDSVE